MAIYPEGEDMFRSPETEVADHEIEDMLMKSMLQENMELWDQQQIDAADAEIQESRARDARAGFDYGTGESGQILHEGSAINYTLDNPDVLFQQPPSPGFHEITKDGIVYNVEVLNDGSIGSVETIGGLHETGDTPADEQLSPSEQLPMDTYSAYSEKFDEYYNPNTGMTWDGSMIETEISPAGQDLSRMWSPEDQARGAEIQALMLGTMMPAMGGTYRALKHNRIMGDVARGMARRRPGSMRGVLGPDGRLLKGADRGMLDKIARTGRVDEVALKGQPFRPAPVTKGIESLPQSKALERFLKGGDAVMRKKY